MRLLTKDKAKKKIVLVGELIGDTLFKTVEQSKHFMRVCHSYGIQIPAYEECIKRDIKTIIIRETDTGFVWETKMSDWIEHGATMDYGSGKQRFLSLKYYKGRPKPKTTEEIENERALERERKEQNTLF